MAELELLFLNFLFLFASTNVVSYSCHNSGKILITFLQKYHSLFDSLFNEKYIVLV